MRNFSKKLAFVLAAAMVFTAFAPAAKADAAEKEMAMNRASQTLYVNEGVNDKGAETLPEGLYGNVQEYDFYVKNKKNGFVWESIGVYDKPADEGTTPDDGEGAGNGETDTAGSPRHNGLFTCKFTHVCSLYLNSYPFKAWKASMVSTGVTFTSRLILRMRPMSTLPEPTSTP